MNSEIEKMRQETAFPSLHEMLASARNQQVTNADEYAQCKAFVEILRSCHKEQSEVIRCIVLASKILIEKMQSYENNQTTIEEL